MAMLLEFLERHRARHLFQSSHLKLIVIVIIEIDHMYIKIFILRI